MSVVENKLYPLPDKVTVTLRNPEKGLLGAPETRALLDLFYVANTFPGRSFKDAYKYYSFVLLAQEFGAIDSLYEFKHNEDGYFVSEELSADLLDIFEEAVIKDDSLTTLSPKYKELIEILGGPISIKNPEVVMKLAEIAKTQKGNLLIRLCAHLSLKKRKHSTDDEPFLLSSKAGDELDSLEQELRGLSTSHNCGKPA